MTDEIRRAHLASPVRAVAVLAALSTLAFMPIIPLSEGATHPQPDLAVSVAGTPARVKPRMPLTYVFTVRNVGTATATAVSLRYVMPSSQYPTALRAERGFTCMRGGRNHMAVVSCSAARLLRGRRRQSRSE